MAKRYKPPPRDKVLQIRLRPDERALLDRLAASKQMTRAEYLRGLLRAQTA